MAHRALPGEHQLAQVNVARRRHPADDPRQREFTEALAGINALAERSPGFVWRLATDAGHLDGTTLLDDPLMIVNLSVWVDYHHLHAFTYRSAHGHFVQRRGQWFERTPAATTALWWIPSGEYPTPEHAIVRLNHLRRYGPTPRAFTLRRRFDPDGTPAAPPAPRGRTPARRISRYPAH
jgi:hypothetical protein